MTHTFAVPDLHGRIDLLEMALAAIAGMAPRGTVIFLGDYVDRGPASRQVVERLMAGPDEGWRWICLQGNHEAMMVKAIREFTPENWLANNGGGATLLSYGHPREGRLDYGVVPSAHINWLGALPLYCADRHRVFVHAGLDEALPLEAQLPRVMRWKRHEDTDTAGYRGRHLVHGHHAASFISRGDRTALDLYRRDPKALAIGCFEDGRPGGPLGVRIVRAAPVPAPAYASVSPSPADGELGW